MLSTVRCRRAAAAATLAARQQRRNAAAEVLPKKSGTERWSESARERSGYMCLCADDFFFSSLPQPTATPHPLLQRPLCAVHSLWQPLASERVDNQLLSRGLSSLSFSSRSGEFLRFSLGQKREKAGAFGASFN